MKKIILTIVAFLSLSLTSCGGSATPDSDVSSSTEQNTNHKIIGDMQETYRTLNETVQNSDTGLAVSCTDKETYDEFVDFVFKVNQVIWGNAEDTIRVRVNYTNVTVTKDNEIVREYEMGENCFDIGKEYILAVEKRTSLLYSYKNLYLINGGLIISVTDGEVWFHGEKEELTKNQITPKYFLSIYEQVPHESESTTQKIYEDSFEQMWNESEYVVRIKLRETIYDGPATATNTYYADVLEQYKGVEINKDKNHDDQIMVALLKNTVAVDEEYIVGISGSTKGDPNTLVFIQETEDSVYAIGDEILNKIQEKCK